MKNGSMKTTLLFRYIPQTKRGRIKNKLVTLSFLLPYFSIAPSLLHDYFLMTQWISHVNNLRLFSRISCGSIQNKLPNSQFSDTVWVKLKGMYIPFRSSFYPLPAFMALSSYFFFSACPFSFSLSPPAVPRSSFFTAS